MNKNLKGKRKEHKQSHAHWMSKAMTCDAATS